MNLIFHIGLNKAGSTALQDALSYNSGALLNKSLCYPNDGKVSSGIGGAHSGNAVGFALAIRDLDEKKSREELSTLISRADRMKVSTLILSTELMYHQIVKSQQREMFKKICHEVGLDDIRLVVIFRNIYTHAISAYSHRCGVRDVTEFRDWIRFGGNVHSVSSSAFNNEYEMWHELPAFTEKLLIDKSFSLTLISHSNDIVIEFSKIIGVELLLPNKRISNVSVTSVEAELLREIRKFNSDYAFALRALLKEVPRDEKASDGYLNQCYYGFIRDNISNVPDLIDVVERKLGGCSISEQPKFRKTPLFTPSGEPELLLSRKQIEMIVRSVGECERRRLSPAFWLRRIVKIILDRIRSS